jgi:hypothetical protein
VREAEKRKSTEKPAVGPRSELATKATCHGCPYYKPPDSPQLPIVRCTCNAPTWLLAAPCAHQAAHLVTYWHCHRLTWRWRWPLSLSSMPQEATDVGCGCSVRARLGPGFWVLAIIVYYTFPYKIWPKVYRAASVLCKSTPIQEQAGRPTPSS